MSTHAARRLRWLRAEVARAHSTFALRALDEEPAPRPGRGRIVPRAWIDEAVAPQPAPASSVRKCVVSRALQIASRRAPVWVEDLR